MRVVHCDAGGPSITHLAELNSIISGRWYRMCLKLYVKLYVL